MAEKTFDWKKRIPVLRIVLVIMGILVAMGCFSSLRVLGQRGKNIFDLLTNITLLSLFPAVAIGLLYPKISGYLLLFLSFVLAFVFGTATAGDAGTALTLFIIFSLPLAALGSFFLMHGFKSQLSLRYYIISTITIIAGYYYLSKGLSQWFALPYGVSPWIYAMLVAFILILPVLILGFFFPRFAGWLLTALGVLIGTIFAAAYRDVLAALYYMLPILALGYFLLKARKYLKARGV